MEIDLTPDYLDPAEEDWSTVGDTSLHMAAHAGIPQAIAEVARREAGGPLVPR